MADLFRVSHRLRKNKADYVGKLIAARLAGQALPTPPEPFVPSKLATITRHVGVAEYGDRSITGFPAWLMWGLLHLRTLVRRPFKGIDIRKLGPPSDHLSPQRTVDYRDHRLKHPRLAGNVSQSTEQSALIFIR